MTVGRNITLTLTLMGNGTRKNYAGEGQQRIKKTYPSSHQRGRPRKQDRNCQRVITIWSWAADGARHQDLLIDRSSVAIWLWLLVWLWLTERVTVKYGREFRGTDPRMTALARTSSSFKGQTRSLVRENAPHQQIRNTLTVIKIWW
jgi:hypothetical protein